MLIVIGSYAGHGVEILANESAEYAIAGAVQNAHIFAAELNGVVEEIGNSLDRFVSSHAAHIDFILETELAPAAVVACGAAYG